MLHPGIEPSLVEPQPSLEPSLVEPQLNSSSENRSFSKRTVFNFIRFHYRFRRAPFSQQSIVNARQKRRSLLHFHWKTEQRERDLSVAVLMYEDRFRNTIASVGFDRHFNSKRIAAADKGNSLNQ